LALVVLEEHQTVSKGQTGPTLCLGQLPLLVVAVAVLLVEQLQRLVVLVVALGTTVLLVLEQ
jgi:hypothetical protein